MSNEKVQSIGGEGNWVGDEMSDEEVADLVDLLEEYIRDIKAQRMRGIAIAAVGPSGVGSEYHIGFRMRRGCSRLMMVGALHLLTHDLESHLNEE